MHLALVRLPLSPEQLDRLSKQGFSIVDQAASTPGLLIVQAPDPQPEQQPQKPDYLITPTG